MEAFLETISLLFQNLVWLILQQTDWYTNQPTNQPTSLLRLLAFGLGDPFLVFPQDPGASRYHWIYYSFWNILFTCVS